MTFIRKPLLFLLVLVCAASIAASGRVSLRLLFDTAIALAAVPIIQVIAFSVVYWTGRRPVGFATAMDDYFAGSWAWFFALVIIAVFGTVDHVSDVCPLIAVFMSLHIDWRFFQNGLGRGRRRALADVAVQRAIGWCGAVIYFQITAAPKAGSLVPDLVSSVWGPR